MEPYLAIAEDSMTAFEKLVFEYNRPLNAFAYRIVNEKVVAEDIVQDVFVSVWSNRRRIDFGDSLGGYLYTLTRNASLNYLRKSKKFSYDISPAVTSEEMADLLVIEEEFDRQLAGALSALPPRTAEVIRLSLLGMPQEEIARQMGVSLSNVKNLKALGIRKLREMLSPMQMLVLLSLISKN